ncbi:hypothetical protein, partial [Bradyrhizobium sp. CCBAU 21362]|uniref:hypothetical protein n=1 Tax=Bradyrhizobium sp. CCBAU 21362 TaxID=1325082 RepID=UPI0023054C26
HVEPIPDSGTCASVSAIVRLAASLGSARRLAEKKSHGSIIAAVSVPWLTERKYLGHSAVGGWSRCIR